MIKIIRKYKSCFRWNGEDFKIEGIESINQNKEYMTFRDFASPDDIYYSSHFSKVNQDVKITSFSDHNLLYGEFKFK